jgi:hypothetical protein
LWTSSAVLNGCPTFIEISFRITLSPIKRVSTNAIRVASPARTEMYPRILRNENGSSPISARFLSFFPELVNPIEHDLSRVIQGRLVS